MMNNKKQGFSLIEVLLYVAILSIVAVFVVYILISSFRSYALAVTNRNINQSASVVMNYFLTELRSAESIDQAESVFDDPDGVLVFEGYDQAGETEEIKIFLSDGQIQSQTDDLDPVNLSTDQSVVTELIFKQVENINKLVGVEILFEGVNTSRRFHLSASLRR